jgi:Domain of unknown function (DUF4157)
VISIPGRLLGRPVPERELPAVDTTGAVIVRGTWVPALGGRLAGMAGPAAAVTLGSTIIIHPATRLTAGLLRHEMVHVRQWRRNPLGFAFVYAWHHFRLGYADNPFEVEARAAETDPDRRRR